MLNRSAARAINGANNKSSREHTIITVKIIDAASAILSEFEIFVGGSLPVPLGSLGRVSRFLVRQVQAVNRRPHPVGSEDLRYLLEVENQWAHVKICFCPGAM